ncbi:hypothetical protein AVEN_35362-1 [Araneus ventricosus]|uniref:Secreted protein n=1 Tax=Araneus ventricosus TaxID=182803 RepID=A0A4Y2RPV9_ARAVE|nr:hypothetical protein AVEN_35362-1 [Araneus ventricosus]
MTTLRQRRWFLVWRWCFIHLAHISNRRNDSSSYRYRSFRVALGSNFKSLSYGTPIESANGLISRIADATAPKLCEEPGVFVKIYQHLQYRCEA